jgi:hypothetical protein
MHSGNARYSAESDVAPAHAVARIDRFGAPRRCAARADPGAQIESSLLLLSRVMPRFL